MSEDALQKSHVTGWITGVLLALVLYVVSATPVQVSFYSKKGPWLPDSWRVPVGTFYQPAYWLWDHPPLDQWQFDCWNFWARILDANSVL